MLLLLMFLRIFLAGLLTVTSTGCAYRLPAGRPPSQEHIRIIAPTIGQYVYRVNTGDIRESEVPKDGRVTADIPGYRPTCGVYLFNVVKLSGANDPLRTWNISVMRNGKVVRALSFRKVKELAMDQQGYHVLQISK